MTRLSSTLTLAFASAAHTYSHLFVLLYATVVLALEQQWGLGYAELFALSIPGTVLFGLGAVPAGWLADRWSSPGMMAVFFLGVGGSSFMVGLAESTLGIGIGLALLGLFASIYHPVGIPWLIKNAANRGRALGINGVFGSAGTAAAAIVAGALTDFISWRAAFIVPGMVSAATGLFFLAAMNRGWIYEAAEDVAVHQEASAADIKRAFLALAVTVLCTGLIYQSTAFALPKIFSERLSGFAGDSVVGIGGMVTLCYVISAMGQIVGGELADRFQLKFVYLFSQVFQLPVLILAFFLHNPVLVVMAALMVGLNTGGQPAENALLARYTPLRWRARVFGAKFLLTLGVSSLGVALIPVIYTLTGRLDVLFIALFAFAATAAIAALLLPGDRVAQPAPAE
jgi:MFS family permease